jgi:hypothetical protein
MQRRSARDRLRGFSFSAKRKDYRRLESDHKPYSSLQMQRRSAQLAISSVLEILLDATNKNR